jgi:hypothetical protein
MTRCQKCGGKMELLAVVTDPALAAEILTHLGLTPTRGAPTRPGDSPRSSKSHDRGPRSSGDGGVLPFTPIVLHSPDNIGLPAGSRAAPAASTTPAITRRSLENSPQIAWSPGTRADDGGPNRRKRQGSH